MADDKTAADYGVEGGSVLHLVLALRGGSTLSYNEPMFFKYDVNKPE